MTSIEVLLESASEVLAARVGRAVGLSDAVALESESTVIKARVHPSDEDLPASVIVKRVTDERFDEPGHTGPPSRFLNEWAALEFLTGLDADVAPKLVAADRSHGLTIVEDLGDLPTLEGLLMGRGIGSVMDGLDAVGQLLGRLHATSKHLDREFAAAQANLGTGSPWSDSTIDQRPRLDEFLGIFDAIGGDAAGGGFSDEVVRLETLVHDESPFRTLIHADAGPHNLLFADADSRLIDFEFATYGNALCDAVGARLGFPQTMTVGRVPADIVDGLEHRYRTALVVGIPEAEDETLFRRHQTAACGHWALNRWANAWRSHLGTITDEESPTEPTIRAMRSVWLVIDGFLGATREFGCFEAVGEALGGWRDRAAQRWPELEPAPTYPALWNL